LIHLLKNQSNNRTIIPDLSFGSNHVDFGGITFPESATLNNSLIETGYIAKAT